MKWTLNLPGNDYSVYDFTSDEGDHFTCKYNALVGSFRIKFGDHHAVFYIDTEQLQNRKITLSNTYGSEIATLNRNLWKENTGTVIFDGSVEKVHYSIDTHSSFIEVTKGENKHNCNLNVVTLPGRDQHFIPVIIALSWLHSLNMVIAVKAG